MKRETCRCGALKFPHKYSHWCDMWITTHEESEETGSWDDEWADERRLDNRERAADMNAESRNPWK